MKIFLSFLAIAFSTNAFAFDAICFDEKNYYSVDRPEGMIPDYYTAKQNGICVIYYLEGYDYNSSPIILYPLLATSEKSGQDAIDDNVEVMTGRLKTLKPSIVVEEMEPIKNQHGLVFQVRYFLDGPKPQEYEAVGYHPGDNALMLGVYSTRSKEEFNKYFDKFSEFLDGIKKLSDKEFQEYKAKYQGGGI